MRLIAGANVAFGVAAVLLLDNPALVATGLAFAYSAAYLIGLPISFSRLRRKLGDLNAEELIPALRTAAHRGDSCSDRGVADLVGICDSV